MRNDLLKSESLRLIANQVPHQVNSFVCCVLRNRELKRARPIDDFARNVLWLFLIILRITVDHFVENDSERPKVARRRRVLAAEQFWGRVIDGQCLDVVVASVVRATRIAR